MIIVMQQNATAAHIDGVISEIRKAGLQEHVSRGAELTIIGAIGDENKLDLAHFEILPGVERAHRVAKQYKIVARATHPQGSVIRVRGIPIGGEQIQVIGGPCSVETQAQMDESAAAVAAAGCRMMRGGAFKPRTSVRISGPGGGRTGVLSAFGAATQSAHRYRADGRAHARHLYRA